MYFVSVCLSICFFTLMPTRDAWGMQRTPKQKMRYQQLVRTHAVLYALYDLKLSYETALKNDDSVRMEVDSEKLIEAIDHTTPLAPYDEIQSLVLSLVADHLGRLEKRGRSIRHDNNIFAAAIKFIKNKGTRSHSNFTDKISLYEELDARGFNREILESMKEAQIMASARDTEYGRFKAQLADIDEVENDEFEYDSHLLFQRLTKWSEHHETCALLLM